MKPIPWLLAALAVVALAAPGAFAQGAPRGDQRAADAPFVFTPQWTAQAQFAGYYVAGTPCYVFYKPLGQTGCSMAIVCPESDIFGGLERLRNTVRAIVIVSLLLMLFFFIRIITRELQPLRLLHTSSILHRNGSVTRA